MKEIDLIKMEKIEGGNPNSDLILCSAGMLTVAAGAIQLGAATAITGWGLAIWAAGAAVALACYYHMD